MAAAVMVLGSALGPGLTGVGVVWVAVFLWFWLSNLREAEWGTS